MEKIVSGRDIEDENLQAKVAKMKADLRNLSTKQLDNSVQRIMKENS